MRVFTHEQNHHQDIDKAFWSQKKSTPSPTPQPTSFSRSSVLSSLFDADNFIIILLLLLLFMETKESSTNKESTEANEIPN